MKVNFVHELQQTRVDTLTESYSQQWEGVDNLGDASGFVQFMSSNDLIFVVLGVSLIIWFILLFFLIRVDRRVTKLEKDLNQKDKIHET